MTSYALFGALEAGLLFGIVAIAVYVSFRILDFPDLTVDGSFPLGAAVAALMIVSGFNPFLATGCGMLVAAAAGALTGLLTVRLGFLHLLSGILVMIALYSINLRIMGRPNIALIGEPTVFTPLEQLGFKSSTAILLMLMAVVAVVAALVSRFLLSEIGLALRATGANSRMAAANGVNVRHATIVGLAVSNGLVGLAGALFAQSQGAADVAMGIGTIIIGLAAVILGESILPGTGVVRAVIAVVIGTIVYRLAVALALNSDLLGLKSQDLNLITAVLVVVALLAPRLRRGLRRGIFAAEARR
jgi:putative tryptophan/tyrosine transport system permease protein